MRISEVELDTPRGPLIHVLGADLMDGTPIYDIKPYVVYADCHPNARSGFVDKFTIRHLKVSIPDSVALKFDAQALAALRKVLELDPRPQYHDDPLKVYGMMYAGIDVRFKVANGVLTVID